MTYCILAAGKGDRLKNVAKLHKALLPINNRAVISHIIDKSPTKEIIVAVGYQKEILKEYCLAAHPSRDFTFVDVSNFSGPGSGPGLSLSCCKQYLQRPFYLLCADCIVNEPLPGLDTNWIGVSPVNDPKNWSTAHVINDKVINFVNKSPDGYEHAFIGVAGIKDYEIFWKALKHGKDQEYEMVSAFYNPEVYPLLAKEFTWFDTGTPENYANSKHNLGNSTLGMTKEIDEFTYCINNRCVKVFGDPKIAEGRIYRANFLKNLIPKILYEGTHAYAYEWIEGKTLYEVNDPETFADFLTWCENNLWHHRDAKITENCLKFYKNKTYSRLESYFNKKGQDCPKTINGRKCLGIRDYLEQIDWKMLCKGIPVTFHGDLQFENVIYNGDFHLIDWRDSFGDTCDYGDLYYDFAKLYGGLNISYHNIKLGKFTFSGDEFKVSIPQELEEMKLYFENWLLKRKYNLYKVRLLSALVYLNMAPLHTSPFDDLLFNYSKYLLSL